MHGLICDSRSPHSLQLTGNRIRKDTERQVGRAPSPELRAFPRAQTPPGPLSPSDGLRTGKGEPGH